MIEGGVNMRITEKPIIIKCSKCYVAVTEDDIEFINGEPVCIMCIKQKR